MSTTRKTWKDFEKAGMLWFVNRLLHVFGWVIVFVEDDKTGEIQEVWPARTTMLGFELEVDEAGQKKFIEAQRRSFDGGF
jgi:hypothetical protein